MSVIAYGEKVGKPLTEGCYHYFDGFGCYVGAVWKQDGEWSAFCTYSTPVYGHLGDFDSNEAAYECLEKRAAGDKTAKGKGAD